MEIITSELKMLHAPPAPKRWKNIWKYELEHAIEDHEDLYSPDEVKRQRKRKKIIVKSKRKCKKRKRR